MELKSFYGKNVNIISCDGRLFCGIVNDYFFPDDNESGRESIVIDTFDGDIIEFTEEDIERIWEA